MLLEQKEVSKNRSGILLFFNKNSIKTCSNISIKKTHKLLLEQKEVSKRGVAIFLFWNKKTSKLS